MAIISICNLDPEWDFENICLCHGLDLFEDPGLRVLNASNGGKENPLNWPKKIQADNLKKFLTDPLNRRQREKDHLILIGGSQADAVWKNVLNICESLKGRLDIILFKQSSRKEEIPEFTVIETSERDPLRQFYLIRLIIEMLQRKKDLIFPQGISNKNIHISFSPGQNELRDKVSDLWPSASVKLFSQFQELLKSGNHDHSSLDQFLDRAIKDLGELGQTKKEPVWEAMPRLDEPGAPFFHSKNFAGIIRNFKDFFYQPPEDEISKESLYNLLKNGYRLLSRDRENIRLKLNHEAESFFEDVKKEITWQNLGLGDDASQWLKIAKTKTEDLSRQLHDEMDKVLERMQTRPPGKSSKQKGFPGSTDDTFSLQRFKEDEQVDDALEHVCKKADQLAGRNWIIYGIILVFTLSILPLAARYSGSGVFPFTHAFDFLWSGIFTGIFATSFFFFARKRHKALGWAMTAFFTALKKAMNRHKDALMAIYEFFYIREAMQRTYRLSFFLELRLSEMQYTLKMVQGACSLLDQQQKKYPGHGQVQSNWISGSSKDINNMAPSEWLPEMVRCMKAQWDQSSTGSIQVNNLGFTGKWPKFKSAYLTTDASIEIKRTPEEPS